MIINQNALNLVSGVSYDNVDEDGFIIAATVYGTVLPNWVFSGQHLLTSLTWPNVMKTGQWQFTDCISFAPLALPDSLIEISEGAFYGCTAIVTPLALPVGLTTIEGVAFSNCTGMTKIWIPISCTTISVGGEGPPFFQCDSSLEIYCEAASKPAGWHEYWNWYDMGLSLSVTWDTSLAAFEAL